MDTEDFQEDQQISKPASPNYKHVKALEALLNIPSEKIHSVVVFAGGSEFKTKMPANVTYAGGYISYIKSKIKVFLSLSEVEAVATAISTGRMTPSLATNREHMQNVQCRLDPDAPRSCPKCGGQMVLRTTKSGDLADSKFWGCSAFPKCRTIQKVT